jgi:hypothetical protein
VIPPLEDTQGLLGVLALLIAGCAALLGLAFAVRFARESGERRQRRFRDRWEPVLHARMAGERRPLPRLARSERAMFLALWLHMLGYVRDEAAESLNGVARELGLESYVLRSLDSARAWLRILATRAVAALRLEQATARLLAKAAQNHRHSSLAAVRALLLIRPDAGLAALQALLGHLEWSPQLVVETFKAGGAAACEALADMIGTAPPGKAKQLIRVAELLEDPSVLAALRQRLLSNRDEEEVGAILHFLGKFGSAADRVAVRSFLSHPAWIVRVQAAAAMGRIGLPEDHALLLPLVRDAHWWVRYRAAQSLLRLLGPAATQRLRERDPDARTREILDRAMAEPE